MILERKQFIADTNIGPMKIVDLGRPDGKKLLVEVNSHLFSFDKDFVNERAEYGNLGKTKTIDSLIGTIQRAEQRNQNNREYSYPLLQREFTNYDKNYVNKNIAWGELDHPEDSVVNFRNASHLITKVWWEGKDVKARIFILDTPSGRILKEIAKYGPVGFSTRGLGSVTESSGKIVVNDDFTIICVDAVTDPSTISAWGYPEGSQLKESKKNTQNKLDKLFSDILGGQR